MKLIKSHTISFKERKADGSFSPKSFKTPQEHVQWHLANLAKVSDICKDVVVTS